MILTYSCLLVTLLTLSSSLPLPPEHLGTWDPDEGHREAYNQWLEMHRRHIMNRDWGAVNPKDYIAHDKFNIADGYDIDLLIVEEMQLLGDPILAMGNEASRTLQKVGKNKKGEKKIGVPEKSPKCKGQGLMRSLGKSQ